jgi:hypothetical protein
MSSNKFILPRKKPTKNNDELLWIHHYIKYQKQ